MTGNRKNITSSCLRSGRTYTPSTKPADQFAKRGKLREGNVTYVSRAAGGPGASMQVAVAARLTAGPRVPGPGRPPVSLARRVPFPCWLLPCWWLVAGCSWPLLVAARAAPGPPWWLASWPALARPGGPSLADGPGGPLAGCSGLPGLPGGPPWLVASLASLVGRRRAKKPPWRPVGHQGGNRHQGARLRPCRWRAARRAARPARRRHSPVQPPRQHRASARPFRGSSRPMRTPPTREPDGR